MKSKPLHVAVAGNIGAGKTTLVKLLSRQYSWTPHLEAVDDNPYLEDFYHDMKKWAFPLQIYFLHSRFNQVQEIKLRNESFIQDRTIYEDAYIFAKNLKDSFYLDERDYRNYLTLFQSMMSMIDLPDLLIYLRASIPKLVGQIARRGRAYENSISIRYLENLNRNYEDWIASYQGNLMILEVDQLNFVDNPEDFEYVVNKLDREFLSFTKN